MIRTADEQLGANRISRKDFTSIPGCSSAGAQSTFSTLSTLGGWPKARVAVRELKVRLL